ncbi:elongation factor Ts [Candidatus Peregrinibacteria bacterium]|nr:elongation factor Ts [Candidatus Peregrinibacteria bacterium]
MIDSKLIIQLREQTGAGIVEAKKALEESGGDLAKAAEFLRKNGVIKAASKSERQTKDGLVHAYVHPNNKVGVLIEVLCETDFVSRNPEFQELTHDLAMQAAATDPLYIKPEDVPPEVIEKEREIWLEEIRGQEKPPAVIEKILQGKLEKWLEDTCLLNQSFIKDEDITVGELVQQKIAKVGENIQVKRFVRFSLQ